MYYLWHGGVFTQALSLGGILVGVKIEPIHRPAVTVGGRYVCVSRARGKSSPLDAFWCMLLDMPALADKVPLESGMAVVHCGYDFRRTQPPCPPPVALACSFDCRGVSLVSSNFMTSPSPHVVWRAGP